MRHSKVGYWTEYYMENKKGQDISFQVGYDKDEDEIEIICIELITGTKDGKIEVIDVTDIISDDLFDDIKSYIEKENEPQEECYMTAYKNWRDNYERE